MVIEYERQAAEEAAYLESRLPVVFIGTIIYWLG